MLRALRQLDGPGRYGHLITWIRLGGGLLCIPFHPFPAARINPGHERAGQAAAPRVWAVTT